MSQQVHNTVFISYRVSVSAYIARAIYLDLKGHGYDVFMDVESIDAGQFGTIILRQIEARAHFLLVCAPGTFERVNERGDWLRREIEHAIDHKRNIVPIIANDFKFNDATLKHLNGKLADLPHYNAISAPHEFFEAAMERLRTRFLKPAIGVSVKPTSAADATTVAAKQAEVESQPKPTLKELSAEEYATRGLAHYDQREYINAVNAYTEAIRLNPRYPVAYNNRGSAYEALDEIDAALKDFDTAILQNSNYARAYLNRGMIYYAKHQLNRALADFDKAILINPYNAKAYFFRANILRTSNLSAALADYTTAIYLDSNYASAYINRASIYEAKENFGRAVEDYQKYLELGGGRSYGDQAKVETKIRELKQKLGRT